MKVFYYFLVAVLSIAEARPFDNLGDLSVYTLPKILEAPLSDSPREVMDIFTQDPKESAKFMQELPLYVQKHNIILTTKTLPSVVRDTSPTMFKKYENLMSILKSKFNRLSKPTQAFITKSIEEVDAGLIYYQKDLKGNFSSLNDETVARKTSIRLIHILRHIVQFLEANPKSKTEIAEQWPNYGELFNSPDYKPLQTMATIDEKQIETLVDASNEYKKRESECILRGDQGS